jgi:hypothetical protein
MRGVHYKQEQCVSLFPRPGNHMSAMSYIFFSPLSMFYLLGEFKNHLSLFIFNKVAKYQMCWVLLVFSYDEIFNQDFAQILYFVWGVCIINRNNVFHSFPDQEITCLPCFYQSYIFFSPLSMFHLLGVFKNHLFLFIFNKVAKY